MPAQRFWPVYGFKFGGNNPESRSYGFFDIALGYVGFKEKYNEMYSKANTAGLKISIGGVTRIGSGVGLEYRLAMLSASFKKAESNFNSGGYATSPQTIEYNDPQGISSINISLGLVFGK